MHEYERWRRRCTRALKRLIGLHTMQRCDLQPVRIERTVCDGYIRERMELSTEPGITMPMYVLVPTHAQSPFPAIIAAHGHGGGGKAAVAGVADNPGIANAIVQFRYDYGVAFARAGFIVFCPDARGFGERREAPEQNNVLKSSCQWLNHMGLPLGQTVTGMWVWDIQRLIDYISVRHDCAPGHIGCVGLSGGGLQTLWTSALDTRIQCAVISGYFYGYRESLLTMYNNCSCNYVPHLYEYVDIGDIAALIAPRPLLVETGTKDPLNGKSGLDNVFPQIAQTQRAYELLGAKDYLYHDVFEGGHQWHGEKAIPWMQRFLASDR